MSYPKFIDCEAPINNEDLDAAEVAMGITLPSDLRQHYLKHNGGRPVKNGFPLDGRTYEVRWFYPVKFGMLDDTDETLEGSYNLVSDVLPEGLIPFCDDSAGNMYCYSTAEPTIHAICYWNHALYKEPNKGVKVLAPSLQAFLEGLVKRR